MATTTPRVPIQTPMFDDRGNLTRTWIIFFERLGLREAEAGPFHRTLLVKDSTVGDDIADHVTVYVEGTALRIVGVLRKPIASDLTVRVNINGAELGTITIPASTAVDTPLEVLELIGSAELSDGDVFSWDITESDGQKDIAGVASFTVEWQ